MIIRRKTYEKLIEEKKYWKKEFEIMKEDRDFHRELVEDLRRDRDHYKEEYDKAYAKFRKVLGSNGGYASSNNKLKREVNYFKEVARDSQCELMLNQKLINSSSKIEPVGICVEINKQSNKKFNRNQKKKR